MPSITSPSPVSASDALNHNGVKEQTNGVNNGELTNIESELDFATWYDGVEGGLLEASHDEYQDYLDQLEVSEAHLESLLANTSSALDTLSQLSESFQAVESQTSAFQKQCEGLLLEQERCTKLADELGNNLQYYAYLEPITRRLNAPGAGNFVRGKEFSDMLVHLDECIDYMLAHPTQKEAETYRARYRLLLTRALTLIRVNFVSAIRDISAEVSRRIADKQLNDTTMSALLYAKFRVGAAELKEVGLEIQKRAVPALDAEQGQEPEYQSLMTELHTSFAAARGRLILPLIHKKLLEISQAPSTSKDLVSFARASISYIRGICLDEFELWNEWFHGQNGLYDFLESICEPLFDYLRPRIIHESRLTKLCQLCTLIQTRYMRDAEEEPEAPDPNQLDFAFLIQPAVEDTQTRLLFRTQAILRDEIEYYKPKPEDLDYPARNRTASLPGATGPVLSGKRAPKSANNEPLTPKTPKIVDQELDSPDEKDAKWDMYTQGALEGWYPTLRKAIWLLSRIYRLVNSTVFDDLAHQIVHQTTLSLHQAGVLIASKTSQDDARLFLIKHLLLLKQQIVAFDIEFVTPEVSFDFSGVTNTFWELRERGGLFNPTNLVRLVGGGLLPRVVENMLDAKAELDGRLRTVINDFTNTYATTMTSSLPESTSLKASALSQASQKVNETRSKIETEVPQLRAKLGQYISDARTRETLVAAVQDQVLQRYEEFFLAYTRLMAAESKAVSKKGKGRDDAVWDLDGFGDWAEGVFGVSIGGFGRSGGGDDSDWDGERSVRSLGSV